MLHINVCICLEKAVTRDPNLQLICFGRLF